MPKSEFVFSIWGYKPYPSGLGPLVPELKDNSTGNSDIFEGQHHGISLASSTNPLGVLLHS